MDVTVKESDGSEQHMTVPYASLPILRREGQFRYAMTLGKTRKQGDEQAGFTQLTSIYGLPYGITLYGGVQYASIDYAAAALGLGLNLGEIGALSADMTQAWSQADAAEKWGTS